MVSKSTLNLSQIAVLLRASILSVDSII